MRVVAETGGEVSTNKLERSARQCLEGFLVGKHTQLPAFRKALYNLWNPDDANANAPAISALATALDGYAAFPPEKRNREGFKTWFAEQLGAEYHMAGLAKRRLREKKRRDEIQGPKPKPLEATSAVVDAVDKFLSEAGVQVEDGVAVMGSDFTVSLQPLYEYVERLQRSALIPSYFRGVPPIPLDELYVELSAATDQRPGVVGKRESRAWSAADPTTPDHLRRWRLAIDGQRISPATLLSRARLSPAVVFGDPGSGKSTLSQFLLHSVGRGLVDPSRSLGIRALPFRIALREFGKVASPEDCSILRYLVRRQLLAPEDTVGDWVAFLSHLASDRKPSRLLLLFDGIDELTPNSPIFGKMDRHWEDITSIASLVFTSRRAGFHPPVRAYGAFELVNLSDISIQEMIGNWFRVVQRREPGFVQSFTSWVFADPRRQEMAGNPCLLALLCYLNQDREEGEFLQATSRAQLYELAVKKLSFDASNDGVEHPERSLDLLASFALSRYSGASSGSNPAALFRRQQAIRFLEKDSRSRSRPRLEPSHVLREWRQMRLVAKWDLGAWHHFIHLTFQEYFAAKALLDCSRKAVKQLLKQHAFNPYWREVWRFYAGMCNGLGQDGDDRFSDLVRAIGEPGDVFGEVAFHVAPLCAEFELAETTQLLGHDLKSRLFDAIRTRHRLSMKSLQAVREGLDSADLRELQESRTIADPLLVARVRAVVELDPAYFLDWVRRTIDDSTLFREQRGKASEEARLDVLLAVLFLNCIYHPDALAYQGELILREAATGKARSAWPPLGPCLSTGRNESLCGVLEGLGLAKLSGFQQRRVLSYLKCTRSKRAIACILRIADAADPTTREGIGLQFHCLAALCGLQDPGAVGLARSMWKQPFFRENMLEDACQVLIEVKTPEAAELLKDWLVSGALDPTKLPYQHLLETLKEWRELPVPESVYAMLDDPKTPLHVQISLWELVLARDGVLGVTRLHKKMRDLGGKQRLAELDWHRLGGLAQALLRSRIPRFEVIEWLAGRVPRKFTLEYERLWGVVIELRVIDSQSLDSERWLISTGIPLVKRELLERAARGEALPWTWLGCWLGASVTVLIALREVLLELWKSLEPDVAAELFHHFHDHPRLVPLPVARALFASESEELRRVGMELLLELDPGLLMSQRKASDVEELLRETSANSGVLFFQDRLYNPRVPGFVEYSPS